MKSLFITPHLLKSSEFAIPERIEKYSSGNDLFERSGFLYLTIVYSLKQLYLYKSYKAVQPNKQKIMYK